MKVTITVTIMLTTATAAEAVTIKIIHLTCTSMIVIMNYPELFLLKFKVHEHVHDKFFALLSKKISLD